MDRKWDNNMTVDELKQEVMTSLTVEELDELRRTIILKITRDKDSIKGSEQLKQFVEKYEEYFSRDNNEIIIPNNDPENYTWIGNKNYIHNKFQRCLKDQIYDDIFKQAYYVFGTGFIKYIENKKYESFEYEGCVKVNNQKQIIFVLKVNKV